jgi:hypothetical protein
MIPDYEKYIYNQEHCRKLHDMDEELFFTPHPTLSLKGRGNIR